MISRRRTPAATACGLVLLFATGLGGPALGQGFTDAYVTFYGEVRQVAGASTVLLQAGRLEMTLVNQRNANNRVSLATDLLPVGTGDVKPYSYYLRVPLAYLPEPPRLGEFLAISAQQTDFHIESITIDGHSATLPDGSREFYPLSFASRGDNYRLDLVVAGDSTDTDGDGLPDWWERLHGLDPARADAHADADGDGWSNAAEFRQGSNPGISNLAPQLATAELTVPELGVAGGYLQFNDSDTAPEQLLVDLDDARPSGFELRWNGTPLPAGDRQSVTLADIQSGHLTIAHRDPSITTASLFLRWTDGGETRSGNVLISVAHPSTADSKDATLWLDARSLVPGSQVAAWSDRSGNGRTATQPLAPNRPSVSARSDKPGVQFDGSTQHLFLPETALPEGDHTVVAAWTSEGSRTTPQVLFSSNRGFLRLEPSAQAISYPGAPVYQANGVAVAGHDSALGAMATCIFRSEGNVLQNIYGLSYNGEAAAAVSLDPVLSTIGARRAALPIEHPLSGGFNGQLHELLVFPTALPEQKLRDVHDYLRSRWSGLVCWDFSESLRSVVLTASAPGGHIIRGGHGADDLGGGTGSTILSGGPGDDTLRGGPGSDTFVFGGLDIGRDTIVGFDPAHDALDFSALFWGLSGDARQFLATRFETNFESPVPTLDTVLILRRPDGTTQETRLRDSIIDAPRLVQLVVEGRLRLGRLSIPTTVQLALSADSPTHGAIGESLDQGVTVELTRGGDGVPGALAVPIGLSSESTGNNLVIEGASHQDGSRALVEFARGETKKSLTLRAVPDLTTEGVEPWETVVLPHFRYAVAGSPATGTIHDEPQVWLEILQANALVEPRQAAHLRIHRDGVSTSALTVGLVVTGTAQPGVHIESLPRTLTIPAGQTYTDLFVQTRSDWPGTPARMLMVRLAGRSGYLVGAPHEATLYAAQWASEAAGAGFDRWLAAASAGQFSGLHQLLQAGNTDRVRDAIAAYAHGEASLEAAHSHGLSLRIVDQRPELETSLAHELPDLSWQLQDSVDITSWADVSTPFSQSLADGRLRLVGPPLDTDAPSAFYRLRFNLAVSSGLPEAVNALSGAARYGQQGSRPWTADPASGILTTTGAPGEPSRLIVEVTAPTRLSFEMAVEGGGDGDSLIFFIDGLPVAHTAGSPVQVQQTLRPSAPMTLMWEFRRGTGKAIIVNL